MKLIVLPIPFIGRLAHLIVECTLAIHLIFSELALIIGSILVDQLSLTMFASIESHTFIPSAIFVCLYSEDKLRFSVLFHHKFRYCYFIAWQLRFVLSLRFLFPRRLSRRVILFKIRIRMILKRTVLIITVIFLPRSRIRVSRR